MNRLWKKWAWLILLLVGISFVARGVWLKGKPILAAVLLRAAWEKTVTAGQPVKAWPWADTWPVARLRVDRLAIDLIVLEGDSGEVLAFGPGHVAGSGSPTGLGNCVLVGHRDTSFQFLQNLRLGDKIVVEGQGKRSRTYLVQSTAIVPAQELYLQDTNDAWLTLITCYPFASLGSASDKRYVIFAGLAGG